MSREIAGRHGHHVHSRGGGKGLASDNNGGERTQGVPAARSDDNDCEEVAGMSMAIGVRTAL